MTLDASHRLRWGILGCGSIATRAVAPAIAWSNNGALAAVASRDPNRAKERAEKIGAARAYGSYEALLADPEIDAVYLGLPNGEHPRWALAAARANKHVLCEKSLTLALPEARELRTAFRSRKLLLVEAFMIRHHPQWSIVRRLVSEGEIGTVLSIRTGLSGYLSRDDDHRFSPTLGGGALFDVTCYGVNIARFVLNQEPLRAKASARVLSPGVDAATYALLEFPEGVIADVYGSLRSRVPEQYTVIVGTRGRIQVERPVIPHFDPTNLEVVRDDKPRTIEVPGANHYLHQVEHFASCARTPERDPFPAEDGVGNVAVCDAIHRAYRTGKTVQVEPA